MTGLTQERRLSRRAALGRAATVGAVAWSAPILLSTPAHATMSAGSRTMRGPFRSLTLAWDPSSWQARPGTGRSPALGYFRTRQLDVNGGGGWKLIATGQSVDLQFGSPLQFKMPPLGGGPTGRQVGQTDDGGTTTDDAGTTDDVTTDDVTTTTVPAEPAPTETVDETPDTTVAEAPADAPDTPDTTVAEAPPATDAPDDPAPTPTDAPQQAPAAAPVAPAPAPAEAPAAETLEVDDSVQSMVIDMSAAATISIGDRFGFFTVVDGQTA